LDPSQLHASTGLAKQNEWEEEKEVEAGVQHLGTFIQTACVMTTHWFTSYLPALMLLKTDTDGHDTSTFCSSRWVQRLISV